MEQDDVMEFLRPWFARFFAPFHKAMKIYNEEYPDHVRAEHSDSVAAHNVHCHIVAEFMREFGSEAGFHFLKPRGLQCMNIRDVVVNRWKKVDEGGYHRNADTIQQRKFDRQMHLPDLPPAALRLTFGYEPDPAFSTCDRVMVARPQGKTVVWASQIVEDAGGYAWVDITPQRLTGTEPRVSGIRFTKPR